MAEVVFSLSHAYPVHDIHVETQKGRSFIVDIVEERPGKYGVWIWVKDQLNIPPARFLFYPKAKDDTAKANFSAAIEYVLGYIKYSDPSDSISRVYNPCNDPFLSRHEQQDVLSSAGINVMVEVNR